MTFDLDTTLRNVTLAGTLPAGAFSSTINFAGTITNNVPATIAGDEFFDQYYANLVEDTTFAGTALLTFDGAGSLFSSGHRLTIQVSDKGTPA